MKHVPLDASLASNKHRSSISRFKAERTAQYQSSNPLPADPFLAAQVRHGKLVDGELVAGLDGSDDEDGDGLNENARRIIAELMGKSPEEKHTDIAARSRKCQCTAAFHRATYPR